MLLVVAGWVVVAGDLPGDRATVRETHELVGTSLDDAGRVVGYAGSAWVLVPLVLGLAAWCAIRRAWRDLALVAAAAVLTWLGNPLLKRVFARDRPEVRELVEPTSRYSFPAGHAVASAAFAAVVVTLAWPTRWRWPVLAGSVVYVVLVGASRLVLGVHHPSDLVAGWALAVSVVLGAAVALTAGSRPRSPG